MKVESCVSCGKQPLMKNEIGINKKLLGESVSSYYCLDCLSADLNVTTQDIIDKIETFREDGCKLFE